MQGEVEISELTESFGAVELTGTVENKKLKIAVLQTNITLFEIGYILGHNLYSRNAFLASYLKITILCRHCQN